MSAETFTLEGAVPITIDTHAEDVEIARMVREDIYPPTNPAVLLRAARTAYLDHRHGDMVAILEWTLSIARARS